MKVELAWQEKMKFKGDAGAHSVLMDAKSPIGTDQAPSPKELLLMGICGCSGMDVVSLLKKYRENLSSLKVLADAPTTKTQPSVFEYVELKFVVEGPQSQEKVMEAVTLSMTKYCGVSAMVNSISPIRYSVELNGSKIGQGQAKFEIDK